MKIKNLEVEQDIMPLQSIKCEIMLKKSLSKVKKMIFENTDHIVAQVKAGTMLLFPSWLYHSVPPNQVANRRISISFNLMFQQYVETMSKPLWEGKL